VIQLLAQQHDQPLAIGGRRPQLTRAAVQGDQGRCALFWRKREARKSNSGSLCEVREALRVAEHNAKSV